MPRETFITGSTAFERVCHKVFQCHGNLNQIGVTPVANLKADRPCFTELSHQKRVFGPTFTVPSPSTYKNK